MSDDAISRYAAIETIDGWLKCNDYNNAERHIMRAMQSVLYDLPSVTPKQRTGHWLRTGEVDVYYDLPSYECSKCGKTSLENGDYCPNCGARMESEE